MGRTGYHRTAYTITRRGRPREQRKGGGLLFYACPRHWCSVVGEYRQCFIGRRLRFCFHPTRSRVVSYHRCGPAHGSSSLTSALFPGIDFTARLWHFTAPGLGSFEPRSAFTRTP